VNSSLTPPSLNFMTSTPLRTSVIGSYPFPGWLEFASRHLDQFGSANVNSDSPAIAATYCRPFTE